MADFKTSANKSLSDVQNALNAKLGAFDKEAEKIIDEELTKWLSTHRLPGELSARPIDQINEKEGVSK
ncbi:hypothetical protein ACTPL8_000457 [Enterococcus faecium]